MMKFKVTEDEELRETILKGLTENKKKYGKRYCPCSTIKNDDTVCQCKQFKTEGICHCGLYIVEEYENRVNNILSITNESK